MSGMIDCRYLNRMYSPLPENRTVRSAAGRTSSFLDMAVKTHTLFGHQKTEKVLKLHII